MNQTRKLWTGLIALLLASFALLLWMGGEIHRQEPPMPERVLSESGAVLYTRADIETGRQVWQSVGGQQLGSVWGHGALVAPDWSADWLHRETQAWLQLRASHTLGRSYASLDAGDQAKVKAGLQPDIRRNSYDARRRRSWSPTNARRRSPRSPRTTRVLFSNDPATNSLRETYAMRDDTVDTMEHRRQLTAFFFWTSWVAATERPGSSATYTNNWPYEPLIGNQPSSEHVPVDSVQRAFS
jgi:nitric oxide reductase subunit B